MTDAANEKPATIAQKAYIQTCARRALMEPEELVEAIRDITGKSFSGMSVRDASNVIDHLQDLRSGQYRKGMFA